MQFMTHLNTSALRISNVALRMLRYANPQSEILNGLGFSHVPATPW